MSSALKEALYQQAKNRVRYATDAAAVLARQRKLYHARVARQREVLRQYEELKRAVAALPMGNVMAA